MEIIFPDAYSDVLDSLQATIGLINRGNGFHDYGDSLEPGSAALRDHNITALALIGTEVSEAIEELRTGHGPNTTYYMYSDGEDYAPTGLNPDGSPRKPEGVPSEVADIVIRAFDFADRAGFDLSDIIREKLVYNTTRGKMHGGKLV